MPRTMISAIQALAPLLLIARASDSEDASTKKLAQPKSVSNSFQVSTPMPGVSRQAQARTAGRAGFQ